MRFAGPPVTGLLLALLLSACATDPRQSAKPAVPEPEPAGQTAAPAPPPDSSRPAGPAARPPDPAPDPSPVTWEIIHLPSGLKSPGGPLHLAQPYQFQITFSGPVDQASVEAALTRNGARGQVGGFSWSGDRQVRLSVDLPALPAAGEMAAVDPSGGKDLSGLPLRLPVARYNFAAFAFWPAEPTRVAALDPHTGEVAVQVRHPQPFQTVSISPDGRRHLLRRHILTPGQSVGITGSAYLLDVRDGLLAPLGVGHLFRHQWSADGSLLVWGGCAEGSACSVLVPPGPVQPPAAGRFGRLVFRPDQGEYLGGASLSPDGRHVALFAGRWGEPLSLHLFAGKGAPLRLLTGVAGVTQGPSGITSVPTAWSPDGRLLAYGDGGVRREEHSPMKVWILVPAGGTPRLLAERATGIGPWSPGGERLFLQGVGVVDSTGKVLLAAAEPGAMASWSPDGRLLFLHGKMYETATWKALWETPSSGPAYWAPDSQAIVLTGWTSDPTVGDGGVYRANGTKITGRYLSLIRPVFSPTGLLYLPDPDRVVDLKTGQVRMITLPEPKASGLGRDRVLGFTAEGRLLLAPGHEWDQ